MHLHEIFAFRIFIILVLGCIQFMVHARSPDDTDGEDMEEFFVTMGRPPRRFKGSLDSEPQIIDTSSDFDEKHIKEWQASGKLYTPVYG